jgi:hypothetical protein
MSRILHTPCFREWKAALSGKVIVFKAIGTLLGWLICCATIAQPTYFNQLYLFSDRADGIGVGGTQKLGDNYINWNSGFFSSTLASRQSMFIIDEDGLLVSFFEVPFVDSIREQSGNIIVLDDTTVIARGYEQILTEPVPGDFVLRKMNIDGTQYWKKRYGEDYRLDISTRVIQTEEGGFAIVGQSTLDTGGVDDAQAMLVKTDENGDLLWKRYYGGSNYDAGLDVLQTPDEGYLVLGWTRSFGAGQRDFYLVKTDAQGNEEWHETYGTSGEDIGSSLLSLSNGNFLLIGGGTNSAVTTSKGYLYEVTLTGQEIWHEEYTSGPEEADHLYSAIQLDDGSLVLCGLADNHNTGGNAGWLLKTDASGAPVWQRTYDHSSQTDLFYNVLSVEYGGFLLSGQAKNSSTNSQDAWLLKVDSIGCPYPNCTVGIEEEEKTVMVDVWPNPVSELLNIEKATTSEALNILVVDVNGREILRFTQNDTKESVDVSGWPSGVYLLKGMDEKGRSFSVKVVKQR